jgi:hypothetical protein
VGPLKVALQNLSESGQDAYVLFVDITKAFDTVNREMLWQILAKYGIPSNLISVIKSSIMISQLNSGLERQKAPLNQHPVLNKETH